MTEQTYVVSVDDALLVADMIMTRCEGHTTAEIYCAVCSIKAFLEQEVGIKSDTEQIFKSLCSKEIPGQIARVTINKASKAGRRQQQPCYQK